MAALIDFDADQPWTYWLRNINDDTNPPLVPRIENNGRRHTYEFGFRWFDDELEPFVDAVTRRVGAIVQLGTETMDNLEWQAGGRAWALSLVINNLNRGEEAIIDHPWGTHRRFNSVGDVENNLAEAIFLAFENMAQSDTEFTLNDLVFELRFDLLDREAEAVAFGRMKSYVRKTIANGDSTQGLYKYETANQACGFKAIIYALTVNPTMRTFWTGSLDWFTVQFKNGHISIEQLKRHRGRFMKLATALAEQLGVEEPYGWNILSNDAQATSQRFVMLQPKFQVVIFNEITRQVMEHRRGLEFNSANGSDTTVLLSYTTGHLQLIRSIFTYLGRLNQRSAEEIFCWNCLSHQPSERHPCPFNAGIQCNRCYMLFANEAQVRDHERMEFGQKVQCDRCQQWFYNRNCMLGHRCRPEHRVTCGVCGRVRSIFDHTHNCAQYKCHSCKVMVDYNHQCPLKRMDPPPDDITPEEEGKHYYAFDVESLLQPQPTGETLHTVNLVVVRRCFSEQEWIFETLDAFVAWLESLAEPSTFFAHNFKGYDGRLVFEHLIDARKAPQTMTWAGAKIMQMQYGRHKFQDTLTHLTCALAQLPKMMGLNEREFKKGFFPYLFNVPENRAYVGPIPDMKYFDPDNMMPKKREEFLEWYEEQRDQDYDFSKELVEYCQSDVRILAKTIETYMINMMQKHPYNPFRSLTSAGYAKAIYTMYYMPDNQLYRLSIRQAEDIRHSMHGGRTDTRRLLKEWTEDEIAQGYYGCYQDVQSLYPTVQFYDPMPVGVPRSRYFYENQPQPTLAEIRHVFGFVCCDIHPTQQLFHPVLVSTNDEGRLVADLRPKTKIVVPTPELRLALDHGYVITKVYWWYEFDQSVDLFKDYFRTFLKDKLEASGMPKWIRTDDDWNEFADYHRENLGIELQRDKLVPNPPRKTGAKVLCNSLWGKFGERYKRHHWQVFDVNTQNDAIFGMERKWIDGDIDISYRRYNGSNTQICMVYNEVYDVSRRPNEHALKNHLSKTHIALASMVTSHARCRLWKELHKLGDRVLYHDTDSIIYEHSPNGYNIPLGRYLGEWEDETDGNPIIKFTSTGPKCYSYVLRKPDGTVKTSTKAKGVTLHSTNSKLIHYESMKQLVVGDLNVIAAKSLLFKYDRNRGTMITKNVLKQFRKTYNKGRIDPTDWKVYPHQ